MARRVPHRKLAFEVDEELALNSACDTWPVADICLLLCYRKPRSLRLPAGVAVSHGAEVRPEGNCSAQFNAVPTGSWSFASPLRLSRPRLLLSRWWK